MRITIPDPRGEEEDRGAAQDGEEGDGDDGGEPAGLGTDFNDVRIDLTKSTGWSIWSDSGVG